jgi:hypothetical protein
MSFARTRCVERDGGGITTEPWRRRPPEISHRRSQNNESERRRVSKPNESAPQSRPHRGNGKSNTDQNAQIQPSPSESVR